MTTREELQQKHKKKEELLENIKTITNILENHELTLMDIVANEEDLKNQTSELCDLMSEIIRLRQWLDFEECDPRRFL